MGSTFKKYASYYDLIYQDKDYRDEIKYLEKIFAKYSQKKIRSILDIACGTGSHLLLLAERGYRLCGSDLSKDMTQIACLKADRKGLKVSIKGNMPMQQVNFRQTFDAVICMFAAIDYLTEIKDLQKTFAQVHKHLRPGGLFIFDIWNGIKFLTSHSPKRTKIVRAEGLRIRRVSTTKVMLLTNRAVISFDCAITKGGKIVEHFKEDHQVRYFFPAEITHFLEQEGFTLQAILPFMGFNQDACTNAWNLTFVAKRH